MAGFNSPGDTNNPSYSSLDGVLFNKAQTTLIQFPTAVAGDYAIPSSVSSIGDGAFASSTNLIRITIPNSVTSIGDGAFSFASSLTNLTIPNSVTNIGMYALAWCPNLTSITVGTNVATIAEYAFGYCSSLRTITVDARNSAFSSLDGVLFNKSQSTLIQYPGGKTGGYTIPSSVTGIGDGAFECCFSLSSVTISDNVARVGNSAFNQCTSLTNVTIPSSVSKIGQSAFAWCTSLSAIMVDTNNPAYSSAGGVLFNKSQTTLIQYPARKAGPSYTIPNGVTNIGDRAFSGYNSLTRVTIPNSVTSIGDWALSGCTSLTSVTIPNSVTNIGVGAFESCTGLNAVYFGGNTPSIVSFLFDGDSNAIVYYLPGTTAWASTFGGRPAVLWNAQVQTSGASFGVRTNRFGFTITGTSTM